MNWYVENLLKEDGMVKRAFEKRGFKVGRTNWDNPDFDWSQTRYIVFRSTWDYFDRFPEFSKWLNKVSSQTSMVNPFSIIKWNMDKHYLQDLATEGINIPPTVYVEPGDQRSLREIFLKTGWSDIILKPAVSGAARHTYKLHSENIEARKLRIDLLKNLAAGDYCLMSRNAWVYYIDKDKEFLKNKGEL